MSDLWNKWTDKDWAHAVYCDDCGLPLLSIEEKEGSGYHMCVYCNWTDDEISILKAEVDRLKSENAELKMQLQTSEKDRGISASANAEHILKLEAENAELRKAQEQP